jgi:very-short-patch-repair endonuclease
VYHNLARNNRKDPTDAERRLWIMLRQRQLGGHRFRRQAPIGDFIVDFVCFEAKLIIELDGGQHCLQTDEDAARTRWMNSQGFQVLRFWNSDIFDNLEGVVEAIARAAGLTDAEREGCHVPATGEAS